MNFSPDLLVDLAGDANPTGLGETLKPRRHVHATAVDVRSLNDDIPEVDANAEPDAVFARQATYRTVRRHFCWQHRCMGGPLSKLTRC